MRQACPYPYADSDDPVTIDCEPGMYVSKVNGEALSVKVTDLEPFMKYEFLLQVRNEGGGIRDAVNTVTASTLPARKYITGTY